MSTWQAMRYISYMYIRDHMIPVIAPIMNENIGYELIEINTPKSGEGCVHYEDAA